MIQLHRKSRTVHAVECEVGKRQGSENFLFISDVHFDAVKCDRDLLYRHLNEAQELGASVFIFGDLFDLMQGRFDPRGNYSELRPEYKSCIYVDEVIQDVGEKLAKYADVIKFISKGNHETNIEKRMMVSPIDRVAQIINDKGGHVEVGGYAGWLVVTSPKKQIQTTLQHPLPPRIRRRGQKVQRYPWSRHRPERLSRCGLHLERSRPPEVASSGYSGPHYKYHEARTKDRPPPSVGIVQEARR